MAFVRILVNAYSLLHRWTELAPGRPRHSAVAREELVSRVTQYHDAVGTPITLVFDGSRPTDGESDPPFPRGIEVIYSPTGQTADQLIERLVYRFRPYGEVLVVTDDAAEREAVTSEGGQVASCAHFIHMVEDGLGNLEREISNYNQKERSLFLRHH